jgi:hypothetical protein
LAYENAAGRPGIATVHDRFVCQVPDTTTQTRAMWSGVDLPRSDRKGAVMTFTGEAATLPAVDESGWEILRHVLDTVPGTILVENPERPTLLFAVDESSPARATGRSSRAWAS